MSPSLNSSWRRWIPFGVAMPGKPRHFREMLRVVWENRDNLPYAWRILRHGVCDGCSLGPAGLRDNVVPGVHLCLSRLKLLRLNTMGALREGDVADVGRLRAMTNAGLQGLGRVPFPLLRRRGEKGFRRIGWDEAIELMAGKLRATPPSRVAWFATSRGLSNEAYYVFQKVARLAGSNNVDLAARLCHAPTVDGLSATLGVTAPTCQLSDFIGTDLVILFGTDLANNQPVTMKYLHYAKRAGTRVFVVNPYREPALERYWVPSIPESAIFGTELMDDFFQVRIGGDIAFINGVLKHLLEIGGVNERFVAEHTEGFGELKAAVEAQGWAELEEASGVDRADMRRFARAYSEAGTAVLTYSMGLTQHANGVDNVRAIVNLALARGMIGRAKCGVMPIRGHSGVQGGGECGVAPNRFPGGAVVGEDSARRLGELWGAEVPAEPGLSTPMALRAAANGGIDFFYNIGGNLLETMPDRGAIASTFEKIALRVHQDIVLNTSTLLDAGEAVLVLPARTRYEHAGGITSTSTERRIRFSPEIPGPRLPETKDEWEIPALLARAAIKDGDRLFPWRTTAEIREEMDRVMPVYKGIADLKKEGDWLQWGGERLLEGGVCPKMPGGRARFSVVEARPKRPPPGTLALTTRRGKQFNSMTYGEGDPLTGARRRDAVILSPADAERLGLSEGDAITLRSDTGRMRGSAMIGDVREGTVQAFWPEANVLIAQEFDPISHVPDYNAFVTVTRDA